MFPPKQYVHPSNFDEYFSKVNKRDEYLRQNFDRLIQEKRSLISKFGDYVDVFAPYVIHNRCDGFLVSGPVLSKCPTPEALRTHWKNWTGTEDPDLNPDFLHYVRVALNTPILDQEGLQGYSRLLELFGQWLAGTEGSELLKELNRLRVQIFSRRLPHPYWVDWAIGRNKFFSKLENETVLPEWVKEETGISRMPTVVAALMPQKPGLHSGNLDVLCLARSFQHECFLSTQQFPETTSRPLGDYGAVLLTSAKPGLSSPMARLEVQEKIQTLCDDLGRRLGVKVVAGIGSIIPGGKNLAKSYQEAVTSLQTAVQTGKITLFSDTMQVQREITSSAEMRNLLRSFSESLALSSPTRLALARERFIQKLLYTGYGPEISRAHMLSVLNILMEQFEQRSGMASSSARSLTKEWINRLDGVQTLPNLVEAFRGIMDSLARYWDKPKESSLAARLNSVIADINRDPSHPWRLLKLSKHAGISPPTFLKWFKKVSGLPFGVYVRKARMNKAKELLQEGHLTLERIAQECGFSSSISLIQIFRKAQGITPGQFRLKGKPFK